MLRTYRHMVLSEVLVLQHVQNSSRRVQGTRGAREVMNAGLSSSQSLWVRANGTLNEHDVGKLQTFSRIKSVSNCLSFRIKSQQPYVSGWFEQISKTILA